jgi:hypothetical protein
MAHRWFDWVCELGGTDGHHLYLIPSSGLDISALIPMASAAFGSRVSRIKDEEEQTSDWQNTEQLRSASGPNSAFRQVAWHFYMNVHEPYFWCELDCIPLRKDWLDRLETEYKSCGKPFMGAHVQIESVPEHMSGNAIYVNVPELAPGLVQRTNWTPKGQDRSYELAFDIAGAREVLPKAHFTNLVQHKFRFKGFESRSEFDEVIDPNAVVFHSDKKGTIFQYLRHKQQEFGHKLSDRQAMDWGAPVNNLSGNVGVASRRGGSDEAGLGIPPAQEPMEWHDMSRKCSDVSSPNVVTKTFMPSDELKTVIAQNSVIKNGLPAMSPPWENKEDTERDIKMLCDTLKLFCGAPVYKGRVREALREAKIIK